MNLEVGKEGKARNIHLEITSTWMEVYVMSLDEMIAKSPSKLRRYHANCSCS
jgi:hypothetical protein